MRVTCAIVRFVRIVLKNSEIQTSGFLGKSLSSATYSKKILKVAVEQLKISRQALKLGQLAQPEFAEATGAKPGRQPTDSQPNGRGMLGFCKKKSNSTGGATRPAGHRNIPEIRPVMEAEKQDAELTVDRLQGVNGQIGEVTQDAVSLGQTEKPAFTRSTPLVARRNGSEDNT